MSDSSGRPGNQPDAEEEKGEQWRFELDEVGEDGEPQRPPMEPESVSAENALFILLGAVGTVLVFWSLVGF
ncbi:hypothetical protein ACFQE1_11195 [Halobium palmae]|uniref:DUF7312 domain-containing protein n=1 Tax=Halobium palmae TaxID=1776492 RepID=A0ABD5S011_9EURY